MDQASGGAGGVGGGATNSGCGEDIQGAAAEANSSLPELPPSSALLRNFANMSLEELSDGTIEKKKTQQQPSSKPQHVKLTRAFEKLATHLSGQQLGRVKIMEEICAEVFGILQAQSEYKLARFVISKFESKCLMMITPPDLDPISTSTTSNSELGASNGNSWEEVLSISRILNDFELCLQTATIPLDKNNNLRKQLQFSAITKTNKFTLQLMCNGFALEIIPALNFTVSNQNEAAGLPSKEVMVQEQSKCVLENLKVFAAWTTPASACASPTNNGDDNPNWEELATDEERQLIQLHENSLLEAHWYWLGQQSEFIRKVLLIVKFWESVSIWLDSNTSPLPLSYDELMEVLVVNAAQREEWSCASSKQVLADGACAAAIEVVETPSYLRAFRKFLVSIRLFGELRIRADTGNLGMAGQIEVSASREPSSQLPHVIGINPFKNLAAVNEYFIFAKTSHSVVTLKYTLTEFDTCLPSDCERSCLLLQSESEDVRAQIPLPERTNGCELLAVIVPFILINEKPEYIIALEKLFGAILEARLGPPTMQMLDFYDLTSFVRKLIKSKQLSTELPLPANLNDVFKIFNLCEPPAELERLLAGVQGALYSKNIQQPEELYNQLIFNEFLSKMEPIPKKGLISIESWKGDDESRDRESGQNDQIPQCLTKHGCSNIGFNIRAETPFDDNPIAIGFLQVLSANVQLYVSCLCIYAQLTGQPVHPPEMCRHLVEQVLKFINIQDDIIHMVEFSTPQQRQSSSTSIRAQPMTSMTCEEGQDEDILHDSSGHQQLRQEATISHRHQDYDITYVLPYKIDIDEEKSSRTTNFVLVSMNW